MNLDHLGYLCKSILGLCGVNIHPFQPFSLCLDTSSVHRYVSHLHATVWGYKDGHNKDETRAQTKGVECCLWVAWFMVRDQLGPDIQFRSPNWLNQLGVRQALSSAHECGQYANKNIAG